MNHPVSFSHFELRFKSGPSKGSLRAANGQRE